ncbi:MAG: transglycosylase SLT domain-containing protein, partial [Candidatus Omnitrophica bacterium]|nr:transglycosylase SLT domain-containing protein [Candidatus Omnitrophota bacterium]
AYDALKRAPSPDDRWAWECIYPRPYAGAVRSLEAQHGLPRGLVYALMRQESAFDPVVVSSARAVGLMQLIPSTAESAAKELELEAFDTLALKSPEVNLKLGGFYIGKLLRTFQGSLPLAAAAYNAGPRAVSHWIEAGADHDTDLWVARIPYDETRTYVGRVLANLARYQWLEGGDDAVSMVPLEIPAGAETGLRLKVTGEGERGFRGGPPGDLYIFITVKPHELFERDGDDIVCEVPVSITQSALGAEIEVPTLFGKAKMKIPAGTQTHKMFRLRGKGLPNIRQHGQGDQFVRVVVETPTRLTSRQKELLEEFAHISGEQHNPISQGFFDKVKDMFGG